MNKFFPIEDNLDLMSPGRLKDPSRKRPKLTIVHCKSSSPLPSSVHIKIPFSQELLESGKHKLNLNMFAGVN